MKDHARILVEHSLVDFTSQFHFVYALMSVASGISTLPRIFIFNIGDCSLLRHIDFETEATRLGFVDRKIVNGWRLLKTSDGKSPRQLITIIYLAP